MKWGSSMIEGKNYYGSLCTKMYEILHAEADKEELDFYLSYANKEDKVLEPLCGSGRFLIPFMEKGYDIEGMDLSKEMLDELVKKRSDAVVFESSIEEFNTTTKYDYIFIPSSSVSLFTNIEDCKKNLSKMKSLLNTNGRFVFGVETMKGRVEDTEEYKVVRTVNTEEGYELLLKFKYSYDEEKQIQYCPSIYELYDKDTLLQQETMDFQIRLYQLGEMDALLKEVGFTSIKVYSDYSKSLVLDDTDVYIYECVV